MPHIHANGDEEQRPRTTDEIAAIEEANRIAAAVISHDGKFIDSVAAGTRTYKIGRENMASWTKEFVDRMNSTENPPWYASRPFGGYGKNGGSYVGAV